MSRHARYRLLGHQALPVVAALAALSLLAPAVGAQEPPASPAGGSCPWPATPGVPWADTIAAASRLGSEDVDAASGPARLLAAGDSAYDLGRHTLAYTAYAGAARDSATYEALWKTGRAAVDVGQGIDDEDAAHRWYALGEDWGRRAIGVAPDRPEGHYVLAEALGLVALDVGVRQRVRMAEEIRKEALASAAADSAYAGAWHILGRWNEGIMDLSGPSRFFAKAFLGAQVFGEASWDKAERFMARATELDPKKIVNHLELARIYIKTDRPAKARPELEAALALRPLDEQDCDYLNEARKLLADLKG